jgi:hypothetical protein
VQEGAAADEGLWRAYGGLLACEGSGKGIKRRISGF